MRAIIWVQFRQIIREPMAVIGMLVLTIMFAFILGNTNHNQQLTVPVFTNDHESEDVQSLLSRWNEGDEYQFCLCRGRGGLTSS